MPLTLADLEREMLERKMASITPEELARLVPKELRLKGLTIAERLEGVPTEERLRGLPAEERLRGLPLEEIEAVLRAHNPTKPSSSTKVAGQDSP